MRSIIALLLSLLATSFSFAAAQEVASPDGKLVIKISGVEPGGALIYRVDYEGKPVVLDSKFSLTCNGKTWDNGLSIASTESSGRDTTWKPLYGERSSIRDHFNEKTFHLAKEGEPKLAIQLIVRVYNEGVAFRYAFSELSKRYGIPPFHLSAEATEYTFPEGTKAWHTPTAQRTYQLLPLANWPGESERPLVLNLPDGHFACLMEAEMVNYSRTKFRLSDSKPNTLVGSMYDSVDELPPFATPWRVIMVAKTAGALLEHNDLILNLNPPSALENTAWIKPGKVMREMTVSTEGCRKLVDFAVAHGIQYIDLSYWNGPDITFNGSQVDVPAWINSPGLDMQEVVRYAKSKGVGVWLYVNQRPLAGQLDTLLPLYESWGIAGLKFGFVHVGSHRWTTWLHEAVKKCAAHHLMVNIHDEYRPTGFSRTYPNLLTQEGIHGNEEMPDADHHTTVAFTRFIAGAADYTIAYFARREFGREGKAIQNTAAHQLALPVVFYSPLQYLYWYDTPSLYQGEPELAFWDVMPTTWDDSRVISGEIGQHIAVARRSGERWFVGVITNNQARELRLPLSFLPPGKSYKATIYADDPAVQTRTHVGVRTQSVDSKTELRLKLPASGGEAMLIDPN